MGADGRMWACSGFSNSGCRVHDRDVVALRQRPNGLAAIRLPDWDTHGRAERPLIGLTGPLVAGACSETTSHNPIVRESW